MDVSDFMDVLEAMFSSGFMFAILEQKKVKCDCSRCCPKPTPQPTIPDCADLVDDVLRGAGVKRPVPTPMKYPQNSVTIFEGPYAGCFGVLYKQQSSPCFCCVLVQTTRGVVKVSKSHCNIHP